MASAFRKQIKPTAYIFYSLCYYKRSSKIGKKNTCEYLNIYNTVHYFNYRSDSEKKNSM
ncbi:hypothetical protein C0J52_18334 [Blattella germanica]|nr:hypothetical protein C0J52_18334 [Blattella germanica]